MTDLSTLAGAFEVLDLNGDGRQQFRDEWHAKLIVPAPVSALDERNARELTAQANDFWFAALGPHTATSGFVFEAKPYRWCGQRLFQSTLFGGRAHLGPGLELLRGCLRYVRARVNARKRHTSPKMVVDEPPHDV